ncbi:MAG: hypothetical protein KGR26_08770, partial [Cyanobacteria bacterium REEB65]|nr:hypothetical protein [Cyanobacteria bacterium REEB65]
MADGISFEVSGLDELIAHVAGLPAKIVESTSDFLTNVGMEIMDESQRLVPYEFGALQQSGEVIYPEGTGDEISVEVSYGNSQVDYAYA